MKRRLSRREKWQHQKYNCDLTTLHFYHPVIIGCCIMTTVYCFEDHLGGGGSFIIKVRNFLKFAPVTCRRVRCSVIQHNPPEAPLTWKWTSRMGVRVVLGGLWDEKACHKAHSSTCRGGWEVLLLGLSPHHVHTRHTHTHTHTQTKQQHPDTELHTASKTSHQTLQALCEMWENGPSCFSAVVKKRRGGWGGEKGVVRLSWRSYYRHPDFFFFHGKFFSSFFRGGGGRATEQLSRPWCLSHSSLKASNGHFACFWTDDAFVVVFLLLLLLEVRTVSFFCGGGVGRGSCSDFWIMKEFKRLQRGSDEERRIKKVREDGEKTLQRPADPPSPCRLW